MVIRGAENLFDTVIYSFTRLGELIHRAEKMVIALILLGLTLIGGYTLIEREFPDTLKILLGPKVEAKTRQPTSPSAPAALAKRHSQGRSRHHAVAKASSRGRNSCQCTCGKTAPITAK